METNNKLYHADLYLRLSREDGDKVESDSIANQRDLLLAFLSSHPEIQLHTVRVDDGYSESLYSIGDRISCPFSQSAIACAEYPSSFRLKISCTIAAASSSTTHTYCAKHGLCIPTFRIGILRGLWAEYDSEK